MHEGEPGTGANEPAAQALQAMAPVIDVKPAAHSVQLADPEVAAKVPGAHEVQATAPASEKVPVGHRVERTPSGQNLPGAQSTQPPPGLNSPGAQG